MDKSGAVGEDKTSPYFETVSKDAEMSIALENVQKSFGNEYVVKRVNLTVYKSEILVLLGHNGAGKTTTLLMITGELSPVSSTIFTREVEVIIQNRIDFYFISGNQS